MKESGVARGGQGGWAKTLRDEEFHGGYCFPGEVNSSCANWIPMKDSKGETVYLKAPRVDYIVKLLGIESCLVWFKQYPQLARHSEEHGQVDLMMALDNWRLLPVRQASRLEAGPE